MSAGSPRKVQPLIPYGTGDVLAIDFVFDYVESRRRFKVLTIIRVDQGSEFTLLDWFYKNGIHLEFTRVRNPNQVIESFNSRLRGECLNEHLFFELDDGVAKINCWHDRYNNYKPHSALDMLAPAELERTREIMLTA